MRGWLVVLGILTPSVAAAQRWQDATAQCLGTTAQWTNKVELADLDKDGHLDILLANGGGYASAGSAEMSRVWKNLGNWSGGGPHCTEVTATVLNNVTGRSRMIKAADVDGDGDLDILTGGAYESQLKLFTQAAGAWTDATTQLPQQVTSAGDAEFGDVDGDGDLDIVIAEWGAGTPSSNAGGRTRLYRNNGSGTFTDETSTSMPNLLVRWSWEIELADVDNDWDLDILVSCKACTRSYLFRNDGLGTFTDDPSALPAFANNYEFEPMDIDNDDDLDLVTVNDGPNVTEHLFINDGTGMFADGTSSRLAGTANPAGVDDNVAVWLDVDSDGDADLMFGTLGAERLLLNDSSGTFQLDTSMAATPNDTPATLGLAVGDIDGDTRPDLVHGQGEIQNQFADKLQLASSVNAFDTQPPRVRFAVIANRVYARVHDYIGPSHPHDFTKVVIKIGTAEVPMKWYGEQLWVAQLGLEQIGQGVVVCATDRAANERCTAAASTDAGPGYDAGNDTGAHDDGGGCCDTRRDARGSVLVAFAVAVLLSARTRSRRRRSRSARLHRSSP
jgi:hypothetical protein